MRVWWITLSVVLSIGVVARSAASAEDYRGNEYRGTWEQQEACTPDVWRLCSDQIPDVDRIVACLRQNTPQLSRGCRAVFESKDQARQPDPRGRAVPPRYAPPSGIVRPQPYDGDDDE